MTEKFDSSLKQLWRKSQHVIMMSRFTPDYVLSVYMGELVKWYTYLPSVFIIFINN